MGMPPGMDEIFSDPEIAEAMKNPKLLKAMEEIRTGSRRPRPRKHTHIHTARKEGSDKETRGRVKVTR
jgi:hypothetical protein